ncbi:hypothetical protein, partial [Escherichia coli]|uniref:hypothetical protein n=1 Tax=Escherichia coli TaxID=562 RepID=UPI00201EA0CE
KTGNNARNGGKNSLNRLIRCVCGKKIGPDPRNFNQRVNLGRNDLLIRTFLSFDTYLQDNVKYRVIINNLYGSEFRIRGINENFVGMDFTCEFRPEKMTNLINIKNRLVIHYLRTIYYEKNYIHPAGSIFAAIQKNESLLKFPSIISILNINLLFNPLNLPGMGSGILEDIMSIPDSSLRKRLGYEVLSFSLQAHSLSQECIDKLAIFFADDLFQYESVCIAAMEHLKSKATAPIQNGPLPA